MTTQLVLLLESGSRDSYISPCCRGRNSLKCSFRVPGGHEISGYVVIDPRTCGVRVQLLDGSSTELMTKGGFTMIH